MHHVAIVQRTLPHYREPFFHALANQLRMHGIELTIYVGDRYFAEDVTAQRAPSDLRVRTARELSLPRHSSVYWLAGVLQSARRADLVIIEQATGSLLNLAWILSRRISKAPLLAYWGHGWDHEGSDRSMRTKIKRHLLKESDWWFAYTDSVGDYLVREGFPANRITVVQNSIEVAPLLDLNVPRDLGTDAVYIGGLKASKSLDILIQAADIAARKTNDFSLVIAGDGELLQWTRSQQLGRPWLQVIGPVTHPKEKAELLRRARLIVMPGRVGLVAVESLAAGVPLITHAEVRHSPEFTYLRPGQTSVVVPGAPNAKSFAAGLVALWQTPDRLKQMSVRSRREAIARNLTLDEMVARFASGVVAALNCQ